MELATEPAKVDDERVKKAREFICRAGGDVLVMQKAFVLPRRTGLKVLTAKDCLEKFGGYTELDEEGFTLLKKKGTGKKQ